VKQIGARRIGALDHPGDRAPHHERDRCARRCEQQRIAQQAQDVPAGIGVDEIGKRESAWTEAGVLGEGVIEKRGQRHENEPCGNSEACDQHQA